VWHGCRAFAPRLAEQAHDSAIYNVASENALFCAIKRAAAYVASKHAVLGLTESLREDLPPHVHAGTIIPGWVGTPIGSEAMRDHAMNVDRFAAIIMPQMLARERFVVSHAYNAVRMHERNAALDDAFARSAPRYAGDDEYDVRLFIERLRRDAAP
jgi:NAD(P)-dependent dehydrogenase (short-subunit alcohol dehydrogenase family)